MHFEQMLILEGSIGDLDLRQGEGAGNPVPIDRNIVERCGMGIRVLHSDTLEGDPMRRAKQHDPAVTIRQMAHRAISGAGDGTGIDMPGMRGDEKITETTETWPTRHWHALDDGRVQCDVCPRECKLKEGQRGLCFVRGRLGDEVVLTTYGRSSGFCVDLIEKKPLNHFLPGTPTLSFGTADCNLACKFCQNWDISKSREIDTLADGAKSEQVACVA